MESNKYILIFILSLFIGLGVTTVYAHDNFNQCDNKYCQPTPTSKPSCSPSPTLVIPIPTESVVPDTDTPSAGISATPTTEFFYPTPTEGSGGYFDDHLGCGTHSCIGKPGYIAIPTPQSPQYAPHTGRAE